SLAITGTPANPVTLQGETGTTANTWSGITVAGTATVAVTGAVIRHAQTCFMSSAQSHISQTTLDTCGTGIMASGGNVMLDGVTAANIAGAAVYLAGGASATITNSIFRNNGLDGIGLNGTGTLTVVNSTFDKNGFALYLFAGGGAVDIRNSIIT